MDSELIKLAYQQGPAAVIAIAIFLFWRRDMKNGISHWKEVMHRMEVREDRYVEALQANTEASTQVVDTIRLCPHNLERRR
jgi:hypothetical protein